MENSRVIENERLLVRVNDYGAQLSGIYDKKNEREVVWCADPNVWNRHAPILFPFVGQTYNKSYKYNGNTYPMTSHGFARDCEFEFEGIKDGKIVHSLKADDKTKEVYPFDFELYQKHSINGNTVTVEWEVINKDDKEMYFSIGAHPGFNVPVNEGEKRSDYYMTFGNKESLKYILISSESGCALTEDVKELRTNNGMAAIDDHMFDKDALIFENSQLSEVGIAFPDKSKYITVKCEGFPYVGVWSKPTAPFVCIEPWYGRCDNDKFDGELKDKTGVQVLKAKESFNVKYDIVVE